LLFFSRDGLLERNYKLIEGGQAILEVEDLVQLSGDEEDLSQVDADLSDLMGHEKPKVTVTVQVPVN
jgi:hypothetical protein